MTREVNYLLNLKSEDLAEYLQQQMDTINEQQRQLESQIELNRNLKRIFRERKKKEEKVKSDEPDFKVMKWQQVNYKINKGSFLKCYKLKIKTPYSASVFNEEDIKLQMNDDIEELEKIIGLFNYIEQPNKIKDTINDSKYVTWYWGIEYEGDIEHDNCIMLYVYCSRLPIIRLSLN